MNLGCSVTIFSQIFVNYAAGYVGSVCMTCSVKTEVVIIFPLLFHVCLHAQVYVTTVHL